MSPVRALARAVRAAQRRPFVPPEAALYEWMGARAVADALLPAVEHEVAGAVDGPVLDVGCGGGRLARRIADGSQRRTVGIDAARSQVRRAGRGGLAVARATAVSLPFPDGRFSVVVSSCSMKHWPDLALGVAECARVLGPGGRVVLAEVDAAAPPVELRAFARLSRLPRPLAGSYVRFARLAFGPVAVDPGAVAAVLAGRGFVDVRQGRTRGLPFVVVSARRPAATVASALKSGG